MSKRYDLPSFLNGVISQEFYERWLRRKAQAHVKRDRKRGNQTAIGEAYRLAIHAAVLVSNGQDLYTGEALNWTLISKYDNDEAKADGRAYKYSLALLPTVDHVGDGKGAAEFAICGWRTNDAKHDLTRSDFVELCRRVLEHEGFTVTR